MDNLYETYGKLTIQAEVLQSKINEVKKQIAEELNSKQDKQEKE